MTERQTSGCLQMQSQTTTVNANACAHPSQIAPGGVAAVPEAAGASGAAPTACDSAALEGVAGAVPYRQQRWSARLCTLLWMIISEQAAQSSCFLSSLRGDEPLQELLLACKGLGTKECDICTNPGGLKISANGVFSTQKAYVATFVGLGAWGLHQMLRHEMLMQACFTHGLLPLGQDLPRMIIQVDACIYRELTNPGAAEAHLPALGCDHCQACTVLVHLFCGALIGLVAQQPLPPAPGATMIDRLKRCSACLSAGVSRPGASEAFATPTCRAEGVVVHAGNVSRPRCARLTGPGAAEATAVPTPWADGCATT